MSYSRRTVTDGVTVMNKNLYDNLQDGIDELKTNPVISGSFSMNRKSGTTIGSNSTAEGSNCTASGSYSHAEGYNTVSSGYASHSGGSNTEAKGDNQFVIGKYNKTNTTSAFIIGNGSSGNLSNAMSVDFNGNADFSGDVTATNSEGIQVSLTNDKMNKNNPTGTGSLSLNRLEGSIVGELSVALGSENIASENGSYAEGLRNISGNYDRFSITSSNISSETIDNVNMICMNVTFSGETFPISVNDYIYVYTNSGIIESSVQNIINTNTNSIFKIYVNENEILNSIINKVDVLSDISIIYTNNNSDGSSFSHSEGCLTLSNGNASHSEGYQTKASNMASHAEGYLTIANGMASHAEGVSTTAIDGSHAEGVYTKAKGLYSHAEGYYTEASGESSHAEGYYTKAKGLYSHAEGYYTQANGKNSHAEGNYSYANGVDSHAEGRDSKAKGNCSHSEGAYTKASSDYQHVQGKYNIEDTTNTYAHIVGGGTSNTDRKNIHTLDWNGNAVFSGDVTATKSDGTEVSLLSLKSTLDSIQVQNFYTGIEAPSNTLGEDGDLYLIT